MSGDNVCRVETLAELDRTREGLLAKLSELNEKGYNLVAEAEDIDTRRDGRGFLEHAALISSTLQLLPEAPANPQPETRGRPESRADDKARAIELWRTGQFSVDDIKEATGLSRATVYRCIKDAKAEDS